MKSSNLLIVFVKNAVIGKAKTRLAKTIGNEAAFEVYKELIAITERETQNVSNCDLHVFFSSEITEDYWLGQIKFVQQGNDLGERMKSAFIHGFDLGYERIVGVGSDLPDLNAKIIEEGFQLLEKNDAAFGPSEDGGYYLIGMSKMIDCIFENKPWSTEELLEITLSELSEKEMNTGLLVELNDIDTIEDLRNSSLRERFSEFV